MYGELSVYNQPLMYCNTKKYKFLSISYIQMSAVIGYILEVS